MNSSAKGKGILVRFSDILCHSEADFFIDGLTQIPEIQPRIPATTLISLCCKVCEKRYCAVIKEKSDRITLHEIDNKIEIGSIIANMLGPKLIRETIRFS